MSTRSGDIKPLANDEKAQAPGLPRLDSFDNGTGEVLNASGHRDQLKRHYGALQICGE